AYKGEEVILNCSVDLQVPAKNIEQVNWKREDGDQHVLVLLYQNNHTISDSSHERYKKRVELFSSEISKGNFSLKLKDVQLEDKGTYICEV
ncbi:polymeric immunoglobulin receptor-like, partial [Silurus asotus]